MVISKNYLNKDELSGLNSLVEDFLNLAESRAEDRIPMGMKDWKELLDDYLKLKRLPILVARAKFLPKKHKNMFLKNMKNSESCRIRTSFPTLIK